MADSVAIDLEIDSVEEEEEKPSKTYALHLDGKTVSCEQYGTTYTGRIRGYVTGQEAVAQAIRKALITPRYKCLIYTDQYGSQIEDAVTCKDASRAYIKSVVPGFIQDALLPDTRILQTSDEEFEFDEDGAYINFTAETIFGKVTVEEVI